LLHQASDLLCLVSVDQSVRLEAGDTEGEQHLIEYFLRCSFSQARMIEVTDARKLIPPMGGSEHNAVGRFPEPGDEQLLSGPSRNFQVFEPLRSTALLKA
jgi:hypothetical protein